MRGTPGQALPGLNYILLCLLAAVLSGAAVFFASQRFIVALVNFAGMKIIRALDRKESGLAQQAKFAYLVLADDIQKWYWSPERSVIIPQAPELKPLTELYRLYTSRQSQQYSYDIVGTRDARGFKSKFTGTHPGRHQDALLFSEQYMDRGFIVMIPDCDNKTLVMGTPENPLFFTSNHESNSSGRKFSMNFEQEMQDDFVYRLGNFFIETGHEVVDYSTELAYVIATNADNPILYNNNNLLQITEI